MSDADRIRDTVLDLRKTLQAHRARRIPITESDTIRVLIMPVLEALGWNVRDLEEVRSEYRHRTSDNPVDVALFLQRSPVLFVEAKALDVSLDDRRHLVQTLNYANTAGVDWCVLTDGDDYRIYKVHAQVEAERKLFLQFRLTGEDDVGDIASRLALIGRDKMGQRAIDALWQDWFVDREVAKVLDGLLEDDAFIRLVARRAAGVSAADVRKSLRRAQLHVDYPDIPVSVAVEAAVAPAASEPAAPRQNGGSPPAPDASGSKRRDLPSTRDMITAGLLRPGMKVHMPRYANSTATVIDGRQVEFNGERMSYTAWGCKVTGWKAIQIYVHASILNGPTLMALRAQLVFRI